MRERRKSGVFPTQSTTLRPMVAAGADASLHTGFFAGCMGCRVPCPLKRATLRPFSNDQYAPARYMDARLTQSYPANLAQTSHIPSGGTTTKWRSVFSTQPTFGFTAFREVPMLRLYVECEGTLSR